MAQRKPTLREGIRSLPAPVWILSAGTFVNRFGSFVAVFLVLYLRDRGYSIAEAGLVVSFYGVGNVIAPRCLYGPGRDFDDRATAWARSDSWMTFVRQKLPRAITFLARIPA